MTEVTRLHLADGSSTQAVQTGGGEFRRMLERARSAGPSVKQQTQSNYNWRNSLDHLGSPFDATQIPLSKLYQMRCDPMIAFALAFIRTPIVTAPWYIDVGLGDPKVAGFVDYALRKIYGKLIMQYCLSLDFGYQAIAKSWKLETPQAYYVDPTDPDQKRKPVWDEETRGGIKALVWKPFTALPPDSVTPLWTNRGEFDGFRYDAGVQYTQFPSVKVDEDARVVELHNSLWATNERDKVFGSLWGYPRVGYAYRYWWSYWYNWALADRAFERGADPSILIWHPDEKQIDENGNPVDLATVALDIGERARSGATVAMPSKVVEGGDGKTTTVRGWDIEQLESKAEFGAFNERFGYLDVLKLRSVMVPEQALIEGGGGTSSRNVAEQMGDIFQESQAVLMAEIDDHINRYVIPQLVAANFPDYKGMVKKVTRGVGATDMDMAKQLIQLIGQSDSTALGVDVKSMLKDFGIPLKTPEMIEEEQRKIAEMVAAQGPPSVAPTGGATGTVPTPGAPQISSATGGDVQAAPVGFYEYMQMEQINLSEDMFGPFQGMTSEIRMYSSAMESMFADAYKDIANYIRDGKALGLSEDDYGRANRLVTTWRLPDHLRGKVRDWTRSFAGRVSRMGGAKNLRAINLDDIKVDPPALAPWLDKRADWLADQLEGTMRDEVRTWLKNEVALHDDPQGLVEGIQSHFADWPRWKADRVAKTEAMVAYNTGTLMIGQANGVTDVQAIDAQRGETDDECQDRDGLVYPIGEALGLHDHPNGTLTWRLLPPNRTFSVHFSEQALTEPGPVAQYDPTSKVATIRKGLGLRERAEYLDALGRRIQRT